MNYDHQVYIGVPVPNHDSCALGFADNREILVQDSIIDGGNAEWGLKMSKCFNMKFLRCTFRNGTERAFDAVRGGSFVFEDCYFINDNNARKPTKHAFSIPKTCDIGMKGGVRDVIFINCKMNDVLLGDYSIYDQIDRPPVRRIKFVECSNMNGGPILVRGYHVDKDSVTFENTPHETFFYWKWVKTLYWAFNRKFGDKRVLNDKQFVITEEEKL